MKARLPGNTPPRQSKWFAVQSANGEFCQYGSLEDCARTERAKFAEELKTREQVDVSYFFEGISPRSRKLIFQNFSKFACTKGCNGRCPFCSTCATPGITKQLTYDSIALIIAEFQQTHAADYSRRISLDPVLDSELLDWAEVDESGDITRDFRDILKCMEKSLSLTPYDRPKTTPMSFIKFMTHVPPHSAGVLLEFLSNTVNAQEYNEDFIRPYISLRMSRTESNDELIARLEDQQMKRMIASYGIRSNTQEYQRVMSAKIGGGGPGVSGSLNHIGRCYPGDSTPIEEIDVGPVHSEGVMLTPDGFISHIWVLPTDDNPRGILQIPFSEETGVIARYDTRMAHLGNIKQERGTIKDGVFQCLIPTLRDTLIAVNDNAKIEDYLTPQNEILREAFVWNSFENNVKTYPDPDKLKKQYNLPEYYRLIMGRLEQTQAILDANAGQLPDNDRAVKYLKETKQRLNRLLGHYDDFGSDFMNVYMQLARGGLHNNQ